MECKLLTEFDLPELLIILNEHASKWRNIALHLGFLSSELDNIEARPLLLQAAPKSWLTAMLTEWLQRAPNNTRGNPSIESLTQALNESGLEFGKIINDFVLLQKSEESKYNITYDNRIYVT